MRCAALLATALLLQSCRRTDAVRDSDNLVAVAGCYTLELGPWSGPFTSGVPSAHQPPPAFWLDTVRLPGALGQRGEMRVLPNTLTSQVLSHWLPLSRDSFEVRWSTGYVGVRLLLGRRGGVWRGRATATQDVFAQQPSAPATARPVRCTGAEEASASVRGILLDTQGRPVERAAVSLDDLDLRYPWFHAITYPDGHFWFYVVPLGRYRLRAVACREGPERDTIITVLRGVQAQVRLTIPVQGPCTPPPI
jgi:hypothetical protein